MGKMLGCVAPITGGASGLGAEDARVLAREGANVVITDMNVALGEAVSAEIPGDHSGLDQASNHGMGQPIDIANMVLYLASDDGRHITGTTITIDNGETAS